MRLSKKFSFENLTMLMSGLKLFDKCNILLVFHLIVQEGKALNLERFRSRIF